MNHIMAVYRWFAFKKHVTQLTFEQKSVFDTIFFDWFGSFEYNLPVHPIFVYKYQLLFFFNRDALNFVHQLGKDYEHFVLNTKELMSQMDGWVLHSFKNLEFPQAFSEEITISEWLAFSEWPAPQTAKMFFALGEEAAAKQVLKEHQCSRQFKEIKKDAFKIFDMAPSSGGDSSEAIYLSGQDALSTRTSYKSVAEDEVGESSSNERVFYQGVDPNPPPPKPVNGHGLNGWFIFAITVSIGVALGSWILRIQNPSSNPKIRIQNPSSNPKSRSKAHSVRHTPFKPSKGQNQKSPFFLGLEVPLKGPIDLQ